MFQWVDEVMREWGRQRRRIEQGGTCYENSDGKTVWHVDGWPERSIAGKVQREAEGAGGGTVAQHFAEVLTGEALAVSRTLPSAPEKLRQIAWVHYVVPRRDYPAKVKAEKLGYRNRKAYYSDLSRLHVWVAARLDAEVPRETICGDIVTTEYR